MHKSFLKIYLFSGCLFIFAPSNASSNQRCEDLFKPKTQEKLVFPTLDPLPESYKNTPAPQVKKTVYDDFVWSAGNNFVWLRNAYSSQVLSRSGKSLSITSATPIFSREGDSFSVHSREDKLLTTYTGPQLVRSQVEITLDHIDDIRNGFIIGRKQGQSGYFITHAKTGLELHHAAEVEGYIKGTTLNQIGFVHYPRLAGFKEVDGFIEVFNTRHMDNKSVMSERYYFNRSDKDNLATSEFARVIKYDNKDKWTIIRMKDLSEVQIPPGAERIYEVPQLGAEYYAIQVKNYIRLYKYGKEVFSYYRAHNEIQLLGSAINGRILIGYIPGLKKLMTLVDKNKDPEQPTRLSPVSVNTTFYRPRIINQSDVVFAGVDGTFYRWSLSTNRSGQVTADFAHSISMDGQFGVDTTDANGRATIVRLSQ